jgi:large subunit ribosomal protein L9
MEIILKQDIKNLGEKDEIVLVKDGYARNFLIPQGMAVIANPTNRKILNENLRQASHRQEKLRQDALNASEGLKEITIRIETLAGADGKIFGSVTPLQFSNKLKELGYEVDRRRITFSEDIKFLGDFVATLNLHKEVKIDVPFSVVQKA